MRGFTLIELVVSVGLFMVVVTIAMAAYLSLITLDRKARALNDVVTNLSFVVDTMSRSIRTGTTYSCNGGTNCWGGTGGSMFSFVDENGNPVTYILKSDGSIGTCVGIGSCTPTSASALTDSRISISNLRFFAQGIGTTGADKPVQPRVVFTMTGTITPEQNAVPISFTLQSSATERYLDL